MDGMEQWPEEAKEYIKRLEQKIDALMRELESVTAAFAEYKKRHPPNTGVKNGKPYHFKSPARSKTSKKPGAKKGHAPHVRPPPEHIDDVRSVPVDVCPVCGGSELSDVQETRERTYEDIPLPRPVAIKLLIERRYCRHCHQLVEALFPDVLPGARLSLRVMLIVTWLKIRYRMTVEAIPDVLETLFGLHISTGEVIHILDQVARTFGPYYDQLVEQVRDAPARYIDETSWRINGDTAYLWGFVSQGEALYRIASSRSHKVPLDVLGTDHAGVDVHDRFSAYKTLARKTNTLQQDCWAHIITNAEELAHFYGDEGDHIYEVVQKTYRDAKAYDHHGTDDDIESLFQRMADRLTRPYTSHHCHRFVMNLLKEKDNLFEFVKNPQVDGTNNAAERALRPPVVARKISGGNRSVKGAKTYEVLLSVVQTLHQHGKNLVEHGPDILLASDG